MAVFEILFIFLGMISGLFTIGFLIGKILVFLDKRKKK